MKLRYQMRGLGIGIIVTALLMGVVKGEKIPLSDAEIKVRALELGMVESDSLKLSDIPMSSDGASVGDVSSQPLSDEESSQPPSGDEDSQPVSDEESSQPLSGDEGSSPGEDPGAREGADEQQNPPGGQDGANAPGESGAPVSFTIQSGATSLDICRQLEELGLVEDANEFETYLYQMSYSRSIRAGTYEIAEGTSPEEIAQTITGN